MQPAQPALEEQAVCSGEIRTDDPPSPLHPEPPPAVHPRGVLPHFRLCSARAATLPRIPHPPHLPRLPHPPHLPRLLSAPLLDAGQPTSHTHSSTPFHFLSPAADTCTMPDVLSDPGCAAAAAGSDHGAARASTPLSDLSSPSPWGFNGGRQCREEIPSPLCSHQSGPRGSRKQKLYILLSK